MKQQQALYMTVNSDEIFFPKIQMNSNNIEIFYHTDLLENEFKENEITKIYIAENDIRVVVLPNTLEVFERWYNLHIASVLHHLTISYSTTHEIFWNSMPNGYCDLIKFDILKEFEKRNFDIQGNIIVEGNNKMRFLYVT
jgi:hypothetical protein